MNLLFTHSTSVFEKSNIYYSMLKMATTRKLFIENPHALYGKRPPCIACKWNASANAFDLQCLCNFSSFDLRLFIQISSIITCKPRRANCIGKFASQHNLNFWVYFLQFIAVNINLFIAKPHGYSSSLLIKFSSFHSQFSYKQLNFIASASSEKGAHLMLFSASLSHQQRRESFYIIIAYLITHVNDLPGFTIVRSRVLFFPPSFLKQSVK